MMITAMTINYSDLKAYTSTFPQGEMIHPDPGNHKMDKTISKIAFHHFY